MPLVGKLRTLGLLIMKVAILTSFCASVGQSHFLHCTLVNGGSLWYIIDCHVEMQSSSMIGKKQLCNIAKFHTFW